MVSGPRLLIRTLVKAPLFESHRGIDQVRSAIAGQGEVTDIERRKVDRLRKQNVNKADAWIDRYEDLRDVEYSTTWGY